MSLEDKIKGFLSLNDDAVEEVCFSLCAKGFGCCINYSIDLGSYAEEGGSEGEGSTLEEALENAISEYRKA
jgi:hypothetical protein